TGQRHKHKSDKHLYKEYVEKPFKLVFKVVTELPLGSLGKQKKRKIGEKQFPGEEKGRKRRRNEAGKDLRCHAPVRLDFSLAKQEIEQTPLQEASDQLMRQLQRKDPSAFFSFPVADFIALGYSMIIKHPVDFSTMQEKIKNNDHQSIEELTGNFKRMCANAMIYRMKILSQERIQSLKQSTDFMADLQKTRKQIDQTPCRVGRTEAAVFKNPSKENKKKDNGILENKSNNLEQEQLDHIVKESGGKLIRRAVNSQCEVERRKPDGTMTLRLLHPVDPIVGEPGYCPVRLGMTTGRLQSIVDTLQGSKRIKGAKSLQFLNAPHYDPTFDDSDLIYSTYGEDSDLPSDFSIHEFLATCQDSPYVMADRGHSRTLQEWEMSFPEDEGHARTLDTAKEMEITGKEPEGHLDSNTQDRLIAVKAVPYFGLPVEVFDSEEAEKPDETTRLPRELQEAQNERMSTSNVETMLRPSLNMICHLGPSYREMHLTEQMTNYLKEFARNTYRVRKAIGSSIPSPIMENNFVDLIEDIQEPKKMDVAECGPSGS
uniref:Bromo domain-containing protein n=1 Tax=Cebus imitator TaxID=2715852 RepID=A0A2K5PY07_CEBIM